MVPVKASPWRRGGYYRDPGSSGALISSTAYPSRRPDDYRYYAFTDISSRLPAGQEVSEILPSIDVGSGRLPVLHKTFTAWVPTRSTLKWTFERYLDCMEGLYPSFFIFTGEWPPSQDALQRLGKPDAIWIHVWGKAQTGVSPALEIRVDTRSETTPEPRGPLEESTQDIIAGIQGRLSVPYANRLTNRLTYLAEVSREEYPEQAPMSALSLKAFILFLERMSNFRYPDIVLTSTGNIRAQWRRAKNQHFAVEFLENGEVRYVVFAPDPKYPDITARTSGQLRIESLMEVVRPFCVEEWAAESSAAGR